MRRLLLFAVLVGACLALLVAPALASAKTFTVYPAGKAADVKHNADTVNIQEAFQDAVAAGPGSMCSSGRATSTPTRSSCRASTAPSRAPVRA